jgi:hypothetical protein
MTAPARLSIVRREEVPMRRFPTISLLPLLVLASFAATSILAEDNPWKSETFLGDYSLLKPVPSKGGQDYVYVAKVAEDKLAQFDAVMVDQPEISISPASPYASAKPDDLRAIAEFMRGAIVERLESRGFRVVEQGGENVLYLRSALTNVQLKKKKRGIFSYTPVGAVVHGVKTSVQDVMKNVDIIDIAGQAEVMASLTGEVLGAMVVKRGRTAGKTGDGKTERMTFDEFNARVEGASERLACRMDNARRPPDQRINCIDPAAARPAAGEGAPGR